MTTLRYAAIDGYGLTLFDLQGWHHWLKDRAVFIMACRLDPGNRMTQAALARALRITPQRVSEIEQQAAVDLCHRRERWRRAACYDQWYRGWPEVWSS